MADLQNGDPNLDGFINSKDAVIEVTHLLTGNTAIFRAFVTQFTDDFQSTWAETQVYGRMDDLATFQRTKRMITVEIDVPSYSDEDARNNYFEGIKLKKFLYPGYEHTAQSPNAAAISSSPLVRVKFMNFVVDASNLGRGLLGFLKGFAMTPNMESGFFQDEQNNIIPRLFKVSLNLTVLHEHAVGWVNGGGGTRMFGSNTVDNNYAGYYDNFGGKGQAPLNLFNAGMQREKRDAAASALLDGSGGTP